jgi:hypothetical protein
MSAVWIPLSSVLYWAIAPSHYIAAYPAIPVVLYLLSVLSYAVARGYEASKPGGGILMFLVMKVARLIISLMMLLVYCLMTATGLKEFVVAFLINYVVYLVMDTSMQITVIPARTTGAGDERQK